MQNGTEDLAPAPSPALSGWWLWVSHISAASKSFAVCHAELDTQGRIEQGDVGMGWASGKRCMQRFALAKS